jgi:hypothetical protein
MQVAVSGRLANFAHREFSVKRRRLVKLSNTIYFIQGYLNRKLKLPCSYSI